MPIGEIIGELILRPILEIVFYTAAYYTGALALWILTFGQLRIAPFSSIETTNKGKNRWNDWSIWLRRSSQPRVLKAECVCLVGLLLWIGVGVGIYFAWKESNSEQNAARNSHLAVQLIVS
jgi:hypothetical protein